MSGERVGAADNATAMTTSTMNRMT